MKDVLFLSNGHGEDTIARKVIQALGGGGLSIDAWPMIGEGGAYAGLGAGLVGEANRLPSAGFATLEPHLMLRDLGAGWIRTHWRQYRAARALRGRHRLLVAVGDIIPLTAAAVIGAPTLYIGCAKSAYYRSAAYRYNAIERRLMRRCAAVFPRDERTARELAAAGIAARYLGNPMMDGLEGSGSGIGVADDATVVGVLPGTREDAAGNVADLLDYLLPVASMAGLPGQLVFAFAVMPGLELGPLRDGLAGPAASSGWRVDNAAEAAGVQGLVLALTGPGGMRALMIEGRFADVLRRSTLVVGMAGTANEQAIGLGLPLVAVPSRGVQGRRYVAMKAEYFGRAAITCAPRGDSVAPAIAELLADPERRAAMGAAGRERMGVAGASVAIAGEIAGALA